MAPKRSRPMTAGRRNRTEFANSSVNAHAVGARPGRKRDGFSLFATRYSLLTTRYSLFTTSPLHPNSYPRPSPPRLSLFRLPATSVVATNGQREGGWQEKWIPVFRFDNRPAKHETSGFHGGRPREGPSRSVTGPCATLSEGVGRTGAVILLKGSGGRSPAPDGTSQKPRTTRGVMRLHNCRRRHRGVFRPASALLS